MLTTLVRLKGSQFNGVKELAETAENIVRQLGLNQGKGSGLPNERTIRYYLAEGLLPATGDKIGVTSVFDYRHLLTIVVIKKLQATGLPISVIKTLISGKSIDELEKLVDEDAQVFTDQTPIEADNSDVVEINDPWAQPKHPASVRQHVAFNEARSYLESLLLSKPEPPPLSEQDVSFSLFHFDKVTEPPDTISTQRQRRYEIEAGIVLQIDDDAMSPNQVTNGTMRFSLRGDTRKHTLKLHKKRQRFIAEGNVERVPVRLNGGETDLLLNDDQKPNRINIPLFAGRWGYVDDADLQRLVRSSTADRRLDFDLIIEFPLHSTDLGDVLTDIANICDAFDHGKEE